jgi:hypothetical protein
VCAGVDAYVGSYGSRLTRNYNANQQLFNLDPSDPTSRLFANLGSVTVSDNRGISLRQMTLANSPNENCPSGKK